MSVEEPRNSVGSAEAEELRARLVEQAGALRRRLDERALKEEELRGDCLLDAADVSSATEALRQHQADTENDRRLLARVESALDRLENGGFGYCVRCGTEIDPERLQALPHIEHCLRCQTDLEKSQSASR
ncbi:TraR/DksA family transcriptional regulator [Streptomyces spinosirectus]|jgi:DnaK suppressor protein|uniref:TraR/DksA family transcriptional regulator n=1 Tax=Streptomyces TaxID=1883 RepID=UPI000D3904CD|nr:MULTISPECIES: TraR/DksA family transcriptional regulator [Streptomyces]MBY8344002.1 TraR/DksA family transcriptional regulator [Streptomyces plumbidurans]PTM92946.1 TraR/DksA family transcriptional regulator [Streptomyces sp. VMFN-G11Ma]UIR15599.1 TraR/DksA family transcriptional regulator [Streptomyces spinosirectus]